ncbi:MAG: alpha/beta hydrolase family protein [Candidatus Xenobia bacterium]
MRKSTTETARTVQYQVEVAPGQTVSLCAEGTPGGVGVLLGHGAGSNMNHPSLVGLVERLAARGLAAGRYNFPYTELGRKAPDRQPVLLATVRAVAERFRRELKLKRLLLGGRSMGGRMASLAVAEGLAADGLVFLAYPLHRPGAPGSLDPQRTADHKVHARNGPGVPGRSGVSAGKPTELRTAHWPQIRCPMLFFSGTRDTLARRDLLEPAVAALRDQAELHWLEGAGHELTRSERTLDDIADKIRLWAFGPS